MKKKYHTVVYHTVLLQMYHLLESKINKDCSLLVLSFLPDSHYRKIVASEKYRVEENDTSLTVDLCPHPHAKCPDPRCYHCSEDLSIYDHQSKWDFIGGYWDILTTTGYAERVNMIRLGLGYPPTRKDIADVVDIIEIITQARDPAIFPTNGLLKELDMEYELDRFRDGEKLTVSTLNKKRYLKTYTKNDKTTEKLCLRSALTWKKAMGNSLLGIREFEILRLTQALVT